MGGSNGNTANGAGPATSLRHATLTIVCALQFVLVLTNGSTTMALPSIKSGFDTSNSSLQWFAALFSLGFALVLVLSGRLGDLFGTRRLLMIGFTGFIVSVVLEASSPTVPMLLLARLLQGIAGGITAPQLSAMIQRTFVGHTRTRAFAVFLTISAGGFMVGQIGGGALMSADPFGFGWRWAFLPVIPLSLIGWFLANHRLPNPPPGASGRLDIIGASVLAVVSFLVMFPLIQGRRVGWPLWIFVILLAAIPVFGAFIAHERRIVRNGGDPLVNPELFKVPSFRVGNAITVLVGLISASVPLYLILTVQLGFGLNAFEAALIAAPMPLANMGGSLLASTLLRKYGRVTVAVGGLMVAVAAGAVLIDLAISGYDVSVLTLVPGFILLGFSLGISIAATIAIVLSDVPEASAGSAAGVQATGLQLSGAIGIAVYGVGFYGAINGRTGLVPYLDGIRIVMWIAIAMAVAQSLLMFKLPKHGARDQGELPLADPELLVVPDLHGEID